MIRYDLGIMYYLSKILRILPWVPWLPRCSKNLVRSCQDSQDASKKVDPGSEVKFSETLNTLDSFSRSSLYDHL